MDLCGPGHVVVYDLVNAPGGACRGKLQRSGDVLDDRLLSAITVQWHTSAKKVSWIEIAQVKIGIGYGRHITAEAIACGPGRRARTLRPDSEQTQLVAMRNTTAAGANLDHFEHRHLQWQTTALGKAVHPTRLEGA